MRERLHLDVYNIIIALLVPVILLSAWGITTAYERNERARQCEDALTYLADVTENAPLYTSAGSVDNADDWVDAMDELSVPEPARDLHDAATSALSFAASVNIEADVQQPGDLYDSLSAFQDSLDEGRETLETTCPDTTPLITDAFPMYFRNEGQE